MDWTLTIGAETKTLADWGMEDVQVRFTSLDADTLQFRRVGAAVDSDELLAYGAPVVLLRDAVPVFTGQRVLVPGEASEAGEDQGYTFLGPWDWLNRNTYKSLWTGGIGGVLTTIYTSHIIQTGSLQQIITAVVNYAIARGAPLQLGTVDIPTTPPVTEYVDKTCAGVIRDVLQYAPDAIAWFDYSTTPPTFHVRQRSNLTPVSLKLPTATDQTGITIDTLRIVPLTNLQVPSVEITCEITSQVDGEEKFSFYRENYPPGSTGLEDAAVNSTINLQGFSATHVTGYVEAATIETGSLAWWTNHLPKLADPRVSGLALVAGSIERQGLNGAEAANLPREIVDGQAAEWMVNPDGSDIEWDDEIIVARFDFNFADDDGLEVLKFKAERFAVRVRTTNAPVGPTDYSTLETFEAADPIPTGLAQYLYDSLSPLHYEVNLRTLEEEITGRVQPRNLLNLTNGKTAWATMNAVVQEVIWQIDSGTTQITAGPPKHLTLSDLLSLMKANRGRRRWTNPSTQSTGELSGPSNVEMSRAGANNDGTGGLGTPSKFVIRSGAVRYTHDTITNRVTMTDGIRTILLDIAAGRVQITSTLAGAGSIDLALADTGGHEIKIREIGVCDNGVNKKVRGALSPIY